MTVPILRRCGVTLIELVVSLAILGLVTGVVVAAWFPDPGLEDTAGSPTALVQQVRRDVIASGVERRLRLRLDATGALLAESDAQPRSRLHFVRVRADGSVIADSSMAIDRLTGKVGVPRRGLP